MTDGSGQRPAGAATANRDAPRDARRLLLAGLVDYAGLFPPTACSMADSVARYDEYRRSPQAWALGKFVVPVSRLTEFEGATQPLSGGETWPLSLIAGPHFGEDVLAIEDFAPGIAARATVGAIEVKASTPEQVDEIARNSALLRLHVTGAFDTYVEVPIANDPTPLLVSIGSHGLRAKVRTGGVETDAFPTAAQLARFLTACATHDVAFKATAGLHHAIRGTYPLTYHPASETGPMFGFLNVFLAALFACDGLGEEETRALLEERDAERFSFSASGVQWRGRTVSAASVGNARAGSAISFGSCSFAEPVADLSLLGLL